MKKITLLLVFIAFIGSVFAQEKSNWIVGADANISNKFIWRGITVNDGLVLQPDVFVGYKDFTLCLWGNATIIDVNKTKANEIDVNLDYKHSFSNLTVEAFINYYGFINQPINPTTEIFLGVFYPIKDFTVFADGNIDIQDRPGAMFFDFGINYFKSLNDKFDVLTGLKGSIGDSKFNSACIGVDKNAFNLVKYNLGLNYHLPSDFVLSGNFQLNFFVDSDISTAMDGIKPNSLELKISKIF